MSTIAILYPGDMGGHVGKVLTDEKFRVVSYLKERDDKTREIAAEAGIEDLPSMGELASVSDLVLSLVPPAAVTPVAAEYIAAASKVDNPGRFVDMNAKSTAAAEGLSRMFSVGGIPFTNASIIGMAARIREDGVIYTSGQQSAEFDATIGRVFRVVFLGNDVAAATAFKMCFAGFNKTITAAIFEIAAAANRFGITERLFEQIEEKMPGVVSDVGKLIGNYPRHLTRRRQEMEELAKTLDGSSLPSHIAHAAAKTLAAIEKRKNFDPYKNRPEPTFMELMRALRP